MFSFDRNRILNSSILFNKLYPFLYIQRGFCELKTKQTKLERLNEFTCVIIYVRKKLQAVEVDIDTEFKESVWVKLNLKGNDKLLFGCVYKSPSSNEAN
jgi:hypothetical protein